MDYKNGKIYKITNCIDDYVYIGSTCQSLTKRFSWHKNRMNTEVSKNTKIYKHINDLGFDKFSISLVEIYPCTNKTELRCREGVLIREQGTLNINIAGRTKEDFNKEYPDYNKNYCKNYYETHKEELLERQKVYIEKNKEVITEKKKIYYDNTRNHVLEQKKEYYQNNKDKIDIYKKEYYQKQKEYLREKIECDLCKALVSRSGLNNHKKTIKCKNSVN